MLRAPHLLATALLLRAATAQADEVPPLREQDVHLAGDAATAPVIPEAPLEAPPPPARRKGLVLEGRLGAMGFLGAFGHVAPPGVSLQVAFGYEVTPWLMPFLQANLAFTDTSLGVDAPRARAFDIFGGVAGLRFTGHVSERVALFGEVAVGASAADVPKNALAILGYGDAEKLGFDVGGRLGVEWYQVDRHLALGLSVGGRDMTGFARRGGGGGGLPLSWEGSLALRYTF